MIQTGFEKRVQVQQILANQLPDYIRAESPKTLDFLKQYYISQEHQSVATDLTDNLDQYIKLDNLTPEVITGKRAFIIKTAPSRMSLARLRWL